MSEDTDRLKFVGTQLADRRDHQLGLTQQQLADRIGVSSQTVSEIERGNNRIQRGKRQAWEAALGLVSGTITRAYRQGTQLEVEDTPAPTARETGRDANDDLPATFEARLEHTTKGRPSDGNDDPLADLRERLTRVEEGLDEERRAREVLEWQVAKLSRSLPRST